MRLHAGISVVVSGHDNCIEMRQYLGAHLVQVDTQVTAVSIGHVGVKEQSGSRIEQHVKRKRRIAINVALALGDACVQAHPRRRRAQLLDNVGRKLHVGTHDEHLSRALGSCLGHGANSAATGKRSHERSPFLCRC